MTELLESTADICARIGENPDRRGSLDDMLGVLDKAGYGTSKGRLYKAQMRGELRYVIFGNRSVHRVADILAWALSRVRRPEDGPAARVAQTRRPRGVNTGAQEHVAVAA
jgi:hypothetical protein